MNNGVEWFEHGWRLNIEHEYIEHGTWHEGLRHQHGNVAKVNNILNGVYSLYSIFETL